MTRRERFLSVYQRHLHRYWMENSIEQVASDALCLTMEIYHGIDFLPPLMQRSCLELGITPTSLELRRWLSDG